MAQGRRAGAKIPSYKKEKEWGRKKDGEGEGKGERERVRWGRGLAGAQKERLRFRDAQAAKTNGKITADISAAVQ